MVKQLDADAAPPKESKIKIQADPSEIAIKAVQKKWPEIFISTADELPDIQLVSTGSISLDYILGGGLVRGRLAEIFGPEQGGKTSLSLMIINNFLKEYSERVLYNDAEFSLDPKLISGFGADPKRITVIKELEGPKSLEAFITLLKSGDYGVCVIDSVAALIPKEEINATLEEDTIGRHAIMMQRATNKLVSLISRANSLGIYINQIRAKAMTFGDPETTTGGHALKHLYSYRIRVEGGLTKSSRILNKDGVVIGHTMKILVAKNKLAPPFRKVELDLIYGKGFDLASELLTLSEDCGLIERLGSYYNYNGDRIGHGRDNVLEFLREKNDLYAELKGKILSSLKGGKYDSEKFEQDGVEVTETVNGTFPELQN